MPKYLNTNVHSIYVDDPSDESQDLTRIDPGDVVEATGRFADNLEDTPGVFRSGSDEAKAFKHGQKVKGDNIKKYPPNSEEVLATDGAHSFPANEQVVQTDQAAAAEAAGQAAQETLDAADATKINYASDEAAERAVELGVNERDLADVTGSGKDGAITVKDVKEFAAQQSQPADLDDVDDDQLREMASEFGIDVEAALADVPEAEHREVLASAVEEAQSGSAEQNAGDGTDGTATNDEDGPQPSGTLTSDQVPKAS